MYAQLWCDAGSRGNPGLAGAGIVLKLDGGEVVEKSWFLGTELTNNEAEYRAFVLGLGLAQTLGVTDITCFLDSKLVVNQVNGEWGCKAANLKPWHRKAVLLLATFNQPHNVYYVSRWKNQRADALANEAMDQVQPR